MKARVKATGDVVEVKYSRQIGPDAVYRDLVTGEHYMDFELSFLPEDGTPDYWTRLEHQYAGMAMQGMMNNSYLAGEFRKDPNNGIEDMSKIITKAAAVYAHALVEKLKEERKWKEINHSKHI